MGKRAMKFRHLVFDFTIASGLVLNAVTAGNASDSSDGDRTISYVPVAGHATGTLSGGIPISQLDGYRLSGGEVSFDGNHITITSKTSASARAMTLTGLVISPELSVHGKEVKYTSGVYFSRPAVAMLPGSPFPAAAENSQPREVSQDLANVEKVNSHAVTVAPKIEVIEKLRLRDGSEVTGSIQKISNQLVTILTKQGSKRVPLETVTNIESPKMFIATVVGHASAAVEPGTPFKLHATKVELKPVEEEQRKKKKGTGWLFGGSDTGAAGGIAPSLINGRQSVLVPGAGEGTASTLPLSSTLPSTSSGVASNSLNNTLFNYVPVAGQSTGLLSGDAPIEEVGDYKLSQGSVSFAGDKMTITGRSTDSSRAITLAGVVMSPEMSMHGKNVKYSSGVYFSRPSAASASDAPLPATVESVHLRDGAILSGSIQKINNQSLTILTKAGARRVGLATIRKIESPRMFLAIVEGEATGEVKQGSAFQIRATKIEIRPFEEEKRRRGGGGWIVNSGALGVGATVGVPTTLTLKPVPAGTMEGITPTVVHYAPVAGHPVGFVAGDIPLSKIGDQEILQGLLSFQGNRLTVKSGTSAVGQPESLTGFLVAPKLTVNGNDVKYSSGVYFALPEGITVPHPPAAQTGEKVHLQGGATVSGSIQRIDGKNLKIATSKGVENLSLESITQIDSPRMYMTAVEGHVSATAAPGATFQMVATKSALWPVEVDKKRRGGGWIVSSGALGIGSTVGVPVSLSAHTVPIGTAGGMTPTVVSYSPLAGHAVGDFSGDLPLGKIGDQKILQGLLSFHGNKLTVKSGTNAVGQPESLTGFLVAPKLTRRVLYSARGCFRSASTVCSVSRKSPSARWF
jgi:lipopolysaccharide export system protein LptA